jgi:cytoskeletal protein RodZ
MNWRFWQKNTPQETQVQTELPEAVQEYYDSTRRARKGTAWMLGVATMIVTVVLASVLYFGGRFVYRKFAGPNSNPGVNQPQTTEQPTQTATTRKTSPNKRHKSTSTSTVSPSDTHTPKATTTPHRSTATRKTSTAVSTTITNTGPGNIVAAFVVTSLVSMAAFELYTLRVKSLVK